uniref:Uncharacterized protein MANES_11G044000 n=1 Tax=Rhizophora mucronata TaxID=61149 RepID=A0A2P2KZA9_RHIMU
MIKGLLLFPTFFLMVMIHLLMIFFKKATMKKKFHVQMLALIWVQIRIQIQSQMDLILRRSLELLMNKGQVSKKKQRRKCNLTSQRNLMSSDCQPKRSLKKRHINLLIFQISSEE